MPIDVGKLAREAGGTKERDEVFGPHYVMGVDALQRFAALVLEAAAVQCETLQAFYDAEAKKTAGEGVAFRDGESSGAEACIGAIRAMKPGDSHE